MIVPEYWAEAKKTRQIKGRQVTLRRFGWSDESEDEAQEHARQRVVEAFTEWEAGRTLHKRDIKVPYNGSDGVPIREEIVDRIDEIVLTRNSYGAICLNTPNVLFADVDIVDTPSTPLFMGSCLLLLLLFLGLTTLALNLQFLRDPTFAYLVGLFSAAILFFPLTKVLYKGQKKLIGEPLEAALQRIRTFSKTHQNWNLRVYRTPAGIRILVSHRTFQPDEPETLQFFKTILVDPIYMRMCKKQSCFRARLTPKPWRIGYQQHLKPQPGVWPIKPERMPDRQRWIEGYERACDGYAACKFIEQLGSIFDDPKAEQVREIHDDLCLAHEDLPIA